MYIDINEIEFMQQFVDFGRADNFTRPALRELFAYYEEIEESTGEAIKLDVIAICCDWCEHSAAELMHEYSGPDDTETLEDLLERLRDDATVLTVEHHNAPDTYLVAY